MNNKPLSIKKKALNDFFAPENLQEPKLKLESTDEDFIATFSRVCRNFQKISKKEAHKKSGQADCDSDHNDGEHHQRSLDVINDAIKFATKELVPMHDLINRKHKPTKSKTLALVRKDMRFNKLEKEDVTDRIICEEDEDEDNNIQNEIV